MNSMIDTALGIHAKALHVGSQRLEAIADNIANADTPDYKARDVDFREILANETRNGVALKTTGQRHMTSAADTAGHLPLEYRVPNQPSLDGNTVDGDLEKAAFMEAAVRYQASLDFLSGKIASLRNALRGE